MTNHIQSVIVSQMDNMSMMTSHQVRFISNREGVQKTALNIREPQLLCFNSCPYKTQSPYKKQFMGSAGTPLTLSLQTPSPLHVGREFVSQSLRVLPDQRQLWIFLGSVRAAGLGGGSSGGGGGGGQGTGCLWEGCAVGGRSRWMAGWLRAMGLCVCRVCTEFWRMVLGSHGGWRLFEGMGGGCSKDRRRGGVGGVGGVGGGGG